MRKLGLFLAVCLAAPPLWMGCKDHADSAAGAASSSPATPAPGASATPAKSNSEGTFPARIDGQVEGFMREGHAPGVTVTIVKEGRTLLQKAYGNAHLAPDTPAKIETRFGIASLTKIFTTIAILKLVDEKKLSIEDPFSKYVKGTPASWAPITVHELLAMQSGIPANRDFDTWKERLQWATKQPLMFEHGTKVFYSNSNFLLLGEVIEAVSGGTWEDFVRTNITAPLGMTSTELAPTMASPPAPNMATGYVMTDGAPHETKFFAGSGWSSGGLMSNQIDLTKFDAALRAKSLLSPASFEAMITPQPLKDGKATERGLGWDNVHFGGHPHTLMKGGDLPGFRGVLVHGIDDKVSVMIQANLDEKDLGALAREILNEVAK